MECWNVLVYKVLFTGGASYIFISSVHVIIHVVSFLGVNFQNTSRYCPEKGILQSVFEIWLTATNFFFFFFFFFFMSHRHSTASHNVSLHVHEKNVL